MVRQLVQVAILVVIMLLNSGSARDLNVLMIAVDDLNHALGCYGHPLAKTPNIDLLASNGVMFNNAYCQIPLCNPSRASILTGRRPDELRVYDLKRHFREQLPNVVTLPELYKKNGWYSARVGKLYHYDVPFGIGTNGLDDPASWDHVVNPKGRDTQEENLIFNAEPHRAISGALSWLAAEGEDEEQTDGLVTSEAIKLLEAHRDKPFFLGVGYYRPHTPFVAPKKYFSLYPLGKIKRPDFPLDDRNDIPQAAFAHNCPVPDYGLEQKTCMLARQAYYASVSFVDAQVGRLLEAVKRLELEDSTIIVFWSDHGYHLGEHDGIWQKRTLFEESSRSPMIICAPGMAGNGKPSDQIVEFIDLYPTITKLCGLKAPDDLPGKSLVPLLKEPDRSWHGTAFTQIVRPGKEKPFMGRSIRTDRWRYTEWEQGRLGAELYDHKNDPEEFINLMQEQKQVPEGVLSRLKKRLDATIEGTVPLTPIVRKKL